MSIINCDTIVEDGFYAGCRLLRKNVIQYTKYLEYYHNENMFLGLKDDAFSL